MSAASFSLDGKNALVTGSDKGLGLAIALGLAEAGANIAFHSRGTAPEESISRVKALGRKAFFIVADLSERESARQLVDGAIEQLGSLDILVNNAGTIRRSPAVQYSHEDWDHVLGVNLSSVFGVCKVAARHMLDRGSGKIINVASLLSFQGGILVPAYAAAKGGVAQLTKALANEWAPRGINVNAIAPGYMATENTAALRSDPVRSKQILERIPAARWGSPQDVSGAAVFLASSASDYVHGHVLVVDGGWLAR